MITYFILGTFLCFFLLEWPVKIGRKGRESRGVKCTTKVWGQELDLGRCGKGLLHIWYTNLTCVLSGHPYDLFSLRTNISLINMISSRSLCLNAKICYIYRLPKLLATFHNVNNRFHANLWHFTCIS